MNYYTTTTAGNIKFKYVIMLQPTSPLRTSKHIDEACNLFLKNLNKAKISGFLKFPPPKK